MQKRIIKIANNKLKKLLKKYSGFNVIILDNWRGYRFILDTEHVRRCQNRCVNCAIYNLLKNEKKYLFSANLYPASPEDKKIFGPQNFLNCKTLKQYQKCYINFLLKKANTEKELRDELNLIKNSTILYTKNKKKKTIEKWFKESIIKQAYKLADNPKKKIIASLTDGGNAIH